MQRTTTILALVQTLLVVAGFLGLGIVLKMAGWPHDDTVEWRPFAVFLRQHGFVLLVLPVLWTIYGVSAERVDRGVLSYRAACIVGVCIAVSIISAFIYAACFPYTRPMWIYLGR